MKIIEYFFINSSILAVIMLLMVGAARVRISGTDYGVMDNMVVHVT